MMERVKKTTAKMPELTIGTEEWHNRSMRGIKVSQDMIQRSDRYVAARKTTAPAPFILDYLVRHANDAILSYNRSMRELTVKLRQHVVKINNDIVLTTRYKEKLEKELDFIRKDIVSNKESQLTRRFRPEPEKDRDGADDLICAELKHLVNSKKVLEVQLRNIQEALQHLQKARKDLKSTLKERSLVMELTNESASSTYMKQVHKEKMRPQTADPKLGAFQVIPIELAEPNTPQVGISIREAKDAMAMSSKYREEVDNTVMKMKNLKEAAHQSVNKGLIKKLAETNNIVSHLSANYGENRKSLQKANVFSDKTGMTKDCLMRKAHLTCRERTNRPMAMVYGRHSGQDLSGAKDIRKATNVLLEALMENNRNIDLLNLAKMNLHNDMCGKNRAIDVDRDVLRLRRRNADHKWSVGNKH